MCSASSAAYKSTRPGCGTAKWRRHGVPEATATARSRARKLLQHLGSPPTMPTACSAHNSVTSQRSASGRADRRQAGSTGSVPGLTGAVPRP